MILLMRFSSLYHTSTCERLSQCQHTLTPSKLYSIIVLIFLWGFNIRCFFLYTLDGGFSNLPKVSTHVYYFGCAVYATCCYHTCSRPDYIPQFFTKWHQIHKESSILSEECITTSIKATTKRVSIILGTVCLCNMAMTCYGVFATVLYDFLLQPLTPQTNGFMVAKVLLVTILSIFTFAWLMPVGLTFVISSILKQSFDVFNVKCREMIHLPQSVESLRIHHQSLTSLVSLADQILSVRLSASLICNVAMSCVVLYLILWGPDLAQYMLMKVFCIIWTLDALISIGIDCVSGAMVNSAVS